MYIFSVHFLESPKKIKQNWLKNYVNKTCYPLKVLCNVPLLFCQVNDYINSYTCFTYVKRHCLSKEVGVQPSVTQNQDFENK